MRAIPRDTPHCRICGCSRMRTDEAVDRGPILLAECRRCGHRWTAPLPHHPAALPHRDGASPDGGLAASLAGGAAPLRGAPVALRREGARVA